MDTEELRVLIRTTADTAGATQTSTALRGVATQGEQVNAGLRRTGQAARESAEGFKVGSEQLLRFGSALVGAELGLSIFATAGERIRETIRSAIEAEAEAERTTRSVAAAYGQGAQQFTQFAEALSQQTGFTRNAILEAALSARTLSANYGLTIQQTQRLIQVSADLARVRGIGVAESFERIQSAIRGEAEASEFLGLTVNDTFIKNNAMNGSLRDTFETMTDAQKAQVRYTEILRQTVQFQGLAAASASSMDGAMGRANLAATNLQLSLGRGISPAVITSLQAATTLMEAFGGATELASHAAPVLDASIKGIVGGLLLLNPPLAATVGLFAALGIGTDKLAEQQRNRADEQQRLAIIQRDFNQQLQDEARLQSGPRRPLQGPIFQRPTGDVEAARELADQVSRVGDELQRISQLRQNAPDNAGLAALGDVATINRQIAANRAAVQEVAAQRRRLEDQARPGALGAFGGMVDPQVLEQAQQAAQRQLEIINALEPIEQRRLDLERQRVALQQQSNQITLQQAQLELALLPARQEIQRIDREINSAQADQNRLIRDRALLLARQAAAPATQALEDAQARQERARLVLTTSGRGTPREDILAARAEFRQSAADIRNLQVPAFDAQRALTLAQRASGAADITEELRQNALRQRQTAIRIGIQPGEERGFALAAQSEQLQLLGRLVDVEQQTVAGLLKDIVDKLSDPQPLNVSIAVQLPDGSTQIVQELVEASRQASMPPIVIQSGVRRPG